jgi:uncharacterized protein (DUF2236 family)
MSHGPPPRSPRTHEEISVLQRVNRERVVLLGWGTAILLQLAHPLVAAGVARHSRFLETPLARFRRLSRTIRVMQALNFGDPQEAARAANLVNAIHGKVVGELDCPVPGLPASAPYSALDPALLLWVLATLLYALPRAYELFVGPLTQREKDQLLEDARPLAVLLRTPSEMLPRTTADLEGYLDTMLAGGQIVVSDTARRLVGELTHPSWPWFTRPLVWLGTLPAIGMLPPALRQAYGLPWTRRHQWTLCVLAWLIRRVLPLVPRRRRYWPAAQLLAHPRRDTVSGAAGPLPGTPSIRTGTPV